MTWIKCSDELPQIETPVLVCRRGEVHVGELREELPTWEETFRPFKYWDDTYHDGQDWEWEDVTHWMPLPAAPVTVCRGCNGNGEVGGLDAMGYVNEPCPFCNGTGLEEGNLKKFHSIDEFFADLDKPETL